MSKAILLSIKPKYVADILNGKKTIEIRKQIPKCKLPIDVYIYLTKNGGTLSCGNCELPYLNGKVVAKFTLRKIEEIKTHHICFIVNEKEIAEKSCLTKEELNEYLNLIKLNPKTKELYCGYAWHIEDLVIFDKPKELNEFHKINYKNRSYTTKGNIAEFREMNFKQLLG